jgi:hypothetical protein
MELDEAIALTIDILIAGRARQYGYDLYPPQVAQAFVERQRNIPDANREVVVRQITPICMDAAWELCRRGLVRPGAKNIDEQAVAETGYSLTEAGRAALAHIDPANILIMQPGSLAATFATFEQDSALASCSVLRRPSGAEMRRHGSGAAPWREPPRSRSCSPLPSRRRETNLS